MVSRVLVVDESEHVRASARQALSVDFEVCEARSSTDAIMSARNAKPDLVLVDLSLKGMGSLALCRAFAADAVLRDVPIVLMAAAVDPVAQALRPHVEASSLLEKPFEFDVLRRCVETNTRPKREVLAEEAYEEGLRRWVDKLEISGPEERLSVLDDCLRHFGLDPDITLQGELASIPLAELLQMLSLQAQTGVLRVENATMRIDICFSSGKIDFVHALKAPPELLLGRVAINEGCITQRELDLLLRYRRTDKLLGAQLVQLGFMHAAELRQVLARQSSELIYEVLRQYQGRFLFRHRSRHTPQYAYEYRLGLGTDSLLMEGYRRVDELAVINNRLGARTDAYVCDPLALERFGQQNLTEEEQMVLAVVRQKATVQQVLDRSPLGTFDTLKDLYRLVEAKLVVHAA